MNVVQAQAPMAVHARSSVVQNILPPARFKPDSRDYTPQYSHVYSARTGQLRKRLQQRAKAQWLSEGGEEGGGATSLSLEESIVDLKPQKRCIILGVLYKNMPSRPSTIDEFSSERTETSITEPVSFFAGGEDKLLIEDESGRVPLAGEEVDVLCAQGIVVTGVMAAVRGSSASWG